MAGACVYCGALLWHSLHIGCESATYVLRFLIYCISLQVKTAESGLCFLLFQLCLIHHGEMRMPYLSYNPFVYPAVKQWDMCMRAASSDFLSSGWVYPPPPIVSGCDIDGCGINLYLKTNLVADWSAFSHPFPGFMESVTD